jgi:hypothetical protein
MRELAVQACGTGSVHTVSRICSEAKISVQQKGLPIFTSPGKKHNMGGGVTNLDDFEKDVLRRSIFGFYDSGEFPTAKKHTLEMRDKINYRGSASSMYKILKSIVFKYRKTNDGRKFLMERGDIVAALIKFLRTVRNLRITGDERPLFYLEETWIDQNQSKKYIWQDSSRKGGLRVLPGKGSRLIVCHAGSAKTGLIPEFRWIFRPGPQMRDSDYKRLSAFIS